MSGHTGVQADPAADAAALLRTTAEVRRRSAQLLGRARSGASRWFRVHDDALAAAARQVAEVTWARYPDLDIPFHSRWRHFEVGGVERTGELRGRLGPGAEQARGLIDLVVVSVLLDAGAGADWGFDDGGVRYTRSEGLAVASWRGFLGGAFSSAAGQPLRVDADALRALTEERLAAVLQAGPGNPLVGLAGRVQLLRRLGDALAADPELFGPLGRPGALFDALTGGPTVHAPDILSRLLVALSPIWLSDNAIGEIRLGDCWRHPAVCGPGLSAGWLPLHKLSQWLTYSLVEPFTWAGVPVTGVESLTGLPEYRNGGLLIDTGVLSLRDAAWAARRWRPGDELVVEWRALTVALLDELAPLVRAELGLDAARLPLACVLEGGTWAAGRACAQRLRGGLPPLQVHSDGTVF
ncbi:URC4/urg3 family protein [Mycolicibacterium sp.]|uniref:URC4/urg3 family protein n=1 Tax=Mycolicibacterium sp. TaxID=2320850 RepID=UPI003D0DAFB3